MTAKGFMFLAAGRRKEGLHETTYINQRFKVVHMYHNEICNPKSVPSRFPPQPLHNQELGLIMVEIDVRRKRI